MTRKTTQRRPQQHAPRRAEVQLPEHLAEEDIPTTIHVPGPDLPDTPGDLLPVTRQRRNEIVERWVAETTKLQEETRFEEDAAKWISDLLTKAHANRGRFREGSAHWQVAVEDGMEIVERLEGALQAVEATRLTPPVEVEQETHVWPLMESS